MSAEEDYEEFLKGELAAYLKAAYGNLGKDRLIEKLLEKVFQIHRLIRKNKKMRERYLKQLDESVNTIRIYLN